MHRSPIKSAARTLEVLELFHEERRPLRLNFIFQKLSYPQSSTTILLKSMLVLGYLKYDWSTRTYFPTPRVAALGDWVNHYVYGGDELQDTARFVFDRTGESVAVSSQNDIFIQHIRVMQPSHDDKIPIPEGSMRVLTHSAAGLVLMSLMEPKRVEKLCRHIDIHVRERALRVDQAHLDAQLKAVRTDGYCMLAAFPFPEASAIAVKLPTTAHGTPLTLAVGGLNSRIMRNRSRILDVLREAVASYEAKLQSRLERETAPELGAESRGPTLVA